MPHILITRPLGAANDLAQRLVPLGYTPVIEPLLTIIPTKTTLPNIEGIRAVMITSANALNALTEAGQDIDQLQALSGLPCFCVGPRTAERAAAFGFRDI